jgi:hypothetical protein
MLGRVRRHRFGSNRPQVKALGLAPSFIDPPQRASPRSPFQLLNHAGSKLAPGRREAAVWDGSTAGSVAFQATVFVPAATHPRPATYRSLARDRGVCSPRSRSKHSSITTTFDRYGHLLPSMDEALTEETDEVGRPALVGGNR